MTEKRSAPDNFQGWLYKWTNYIKGYQKRWFVLRSGLLSYYRNQAEISHTCRGTINLSNSFIHTEDSCCFIISNGSTQTFHLKSSSEVERQRWVTALELAKTKANNIESEEEIEVNRECEGSSTLTDSAMELDSVLKSLTSKLDDLQTCSDLITKHGATLQRALAELEQLDNTSQNCHAKSGSPSCNQNAASTGQTSDPGAMASKIKAVNERATLFRITSNAMVNASSDYLQVSQSQAKRWHRTLRIEHERRLRLEQVVEQLAKQHESLEQKARQRRQRKTTGGATTNTATTSSGGPVPGSAVKVVSASSSSTSSSSAAGQGAITSSSAAVTPASAANMRTKVQSEQQQHRPTYTMDNYDDDDDDEDDEDKMDDNSLSSDESDNDDYDDFFDAVEDEKNLMNVYENNTHKRTPSNLSSDSFGAPNQAASQVVSGQAIRGVTVSTDNCNNENNSIMGHFDSDSENEINKNICSTISSVMRQSLAQVPPIPRAPLVVVTDPKEREKSRDQRRKIIPERPNYSINLWSIMKNSIGRDLSKIPMPVNFSEPLSFLQRLMEDNEYAGEVLDRAASCQDSCEQLAYVAAFTTSSYSTTTNRSAKPFNPLLGETYECDRTRDLGWRSFTEQVSHHPPMVAMFTEGVKWTSWQEFTMSSKFRGKYLQIIPLGIAHLHFDQSNNHYTWRKVTTTVHNIIVGKLWVDNHGEMEIQNHTTGDTCVMKYSPYSYFSREVPRKVSGVISNKEGVVKWVIQGTWDEMIEGSKVLSVSENSRGKTIYETGPTVTMWKRHQAPTELEKCYNFTKFAVELNEMEEGIAPSDSRNRPDQRLMEEGDWDQANEVKIKLEEEQRERRHKKESIAIDDEKAGKSVSGYEPKWFRKETDPQTGNLIHMYKGNYWESKEKKDWSNSTNIFSST